MENKRTAFFQALNLLSTGDRAALRRSIGIRLSDADGKAMSVFYRCLPAGTPEREEDRWFAVACLSCLWDPDNREGTPMEQVIANLIRSKDLTDSTTHRIEVLLDTQWDNDGYMLTKLARMVKLVRQKSNRIYIDFDALLDDLIYWNSVNQSVQKKWARAIFTN